MAAVHGAARTVLLSKWYDGRGECDQAAFSFPYSDWRFSLQVVVYHTIAGETLRQVV